MNVKWSISDTRLANRSVCKGKASLLSLLLFLGLPFLPSSIQAQERDTLIIMVHDTVYVPMPATVQSDKNRDKDTVLISYRRESRYDKRVHRYRTRWSALIPTHVKLQYAGNMGLLSIGTGWDYGKRNQWETDIYIGFLPKYQSHENKATFTIKQNYIPWSLQVRQSRFSVEPLTCGIYLNSVLSDEFWVSEPSRYPSGYYGFSSKIRIHMFLGQRFTYNIDPQQRFTAKSITLFYELSTCDLYIASGFTNRYLKPRDYLSLSFGIKLQLL